MVVAVPLPSATRNSREPLSVSQHSPSQQVNKATVEIVGEFLSAGRGGQCGVSSFLHRTFSNTAGDADQREPCAKYDSTVVCGEMLVKLFSAVRVCKRVN